MTEGTDEINGTGYYDDVLDRANTDFHDIQRVLTYYQNYGSLSPEVFNIVLQSYRLTQESNKIISEIGFKVSCQANIGASYI